MCWNSSAGWTVTVKLGIDLTLSRNGVEASTGLTMFTSPFCTAGGCWSSERMNRKTILLSVPAGPQ